MMVGLLKAIQSQFNSDDALMQRFPDGVYHGRNPDESALPTIWVEANAKPRNPDTCGFVETVYTVTFNVWTATDIEAAEAVDELKDAFTYEELDTEDNDEPHLETTLLQEQVEYTDERVWRGIVQFEVELQQEFGPEA